ncbi:MAG: autotransporter-associated beta strand repeat-containing protein, partial [Chlamydiota bacterium]
MRKVYLWLALFFFQGAFLYSSVWTVDSNGNWSFANNWNPNNVPGSPGEPTADFGAIITQPRTITVDQNFTITGLTFNNTVPYTLIPLNNSILTVNGTVAVLSGSHNMNVPIRKATPLTMDTSANTEITVGGVITGSGNVIKTGAGTLVLTNSNNKNTVYATTIQGGILSISSGDQLGGGNLVLSGGTLEATAALTQPHTLVLTGGGGIIDTGAFTVTQQGIVSGPGGLTKVGTGKLILTNTLNGSQTLFPTTVEAGILSISSGNQLGSGNLTLNGGTLEASAALTQPNTLVLTGSGGTIDTGTFTVTQQGIVSGPGGLTKVGTGKLILTNTLNGSQTLFPTTVEAGILSISSGDQLGSGNLTLNGGTLEASAALTQPNTLVLTGSGGTIDTGTFTVTQQGIVSGPGGLTKVGTGKLILTNTLNGSQTLFPTTVEAGILS